MAHPCILISSELNLHREVLLGALRALRPHLPVHAVAPAEIGAATTCPEPHLVICSDLEVIQQARPYAWILLYPDDRNLAHVGIGGSLRTLFDASIHDLIEVIDEVWCAGAGASAGPPFPSFG